MNLLKLSLLALTVLFLLGCSDNLNASMLGELETMTMQNSYTQNNWSFSFNYPGIDTLTVKEKTPEDNELLRLVYYDTVLPVIEVKLLPNGEFTFTQKYSPDDFFNLAKESFVVSEQSTDELPENTET